MSQILLLDSVDVDTAGEAFNVDGGFYTVVVEATSFGGGTVTLQGRYGKAGSWIVLTDNGVPAEYTESILRGLNDFARGMEIRAVLSSSTSASGVTVRLV